MVFLDVKPRGLVDWFRAIFCPCLGRRVRRVGERRPDSENSELRATSRGRGGGGGAVSEWMVHYLVVSRHSVVRLPLVLGSR